MKHLGTVPLETQRLILRRYQMADAQDMFANWLTDREVSRFWTWQPHTDISETKAALEQWISQYSNDNYYHWVIVAKQNLQPIGYIYLNTVDNSLGSAAVHYLLSRPYWNQGLASEACKEVIEFAFGRVGFRRIHSHHHAGNPASGRVMEKCGMKHIKTEYRRLEQERLCGDYLCYEILNDQGLI